MNETTLKPHEDYCSLQFLTWVSHQSRIEVLLKPIDQLQRANVSSVTSAKELFVTRTFMGNVCVCLCVTHSARMRSFRESAGNFVGRLIIWPAGRVKVRIEFVWDPQPVATHLLVLQAPLRVGDELDVLTSQSHQLTVARPQRYILIQGETSRTSVIYNETS